MKYNIISSGSSGNCCILNDYLMIDIGVSYKAIKPFKSKLKLLLLTHIHSDHINTKTLKRLIKERPTLRIGCCRWMLPKLEGIPKRNIDILEIGKKSKYSLFQITPVKLYHNVDNCGFRIFIGNYKIFYATDTGTLEGISAKNYNLYMVECNYTDEDIKERINQKTAKGQFAYEFDVLKNHLSRAQCDKFIAENAGQNSKFVYLHQHRDKAEKKRGFEI